METCPYDCSNKTEFGFCKTTGCINVKYAQIAFWSYANVIPSPCVRCPNNLVNGGTGNCTCSLGGRNIC